MFREYISARFPVPRYTLRQDESNGKTGATRLLTFYQVFGTIIGLEIVDYMRLSSSRCAYLAI